MYIQLIVNPYELFNVLNTAWIITTEACESQSIAFMWYSAYPVNPNVPEIRIEYTVFILWSMECIIITVIDS